MSQLGFELQPGKGNLFHNRRKTTIAHPDYSGRFKTPDGTEYEAVAWIKTDRRNKPYLNISINGVVPPKEEIINH